jgi:hypothetical protein
VDDATSLYAFVFALNAVTGTAVGPFSTPMNLDPHNTQPSGPT